MPEADWRGSVEGGGRVERDMYVGHLHLVQEDEDRDQVGEVSCARSVLGLLFDMRRPGARDVPSMRKMFMVMD